MEKTTLITLAAVSALACGLAGCTESALDKPPGTYSSDTKSTDAYGTTTEHQSTTTVKEDDDGHKKAVVRTKTTRDPKGLFNKTTTEKSQQVIEDDQ